jgi:exodeoxyribonuclease III
MKLYSWNVNGYRAVLKKNYQEWFDQCGGDVVCLQEIKAHPDQLSETDQCPSGYGAVWNPSVVKKGYSGTACFHRRAPLTESLELPDPVFQGEGRLVHLEYDAFHLFNIYFPNGQMNEDRLKYKLGFYDSFLGYAQELRKAKPIVVCGDFNTAHKEIDLARPKANEKVSGFLPIERAWMDHFVAQGYVDTFREFDQAGGNYSWWSYLRKGRERNVGWRLDYFFVSDELRPAVKNAWIATDVMGSDHCPVGLELDV